MHMLNISPCCGLTELAGMNGVTVAEIQQILPACRTMVIATVTQHQKAAKKVLEKAGFKVMKRFRNRNTTNYVYLMGYDKSAH